MDTERDRRGAAGGHGRAADDLDPVEAGEHGLEKLFGLGALAGRTVLVVGGGDAWTSLAAQRLGARRVVSLDPDPTRAAALCRRLGDEDTWLVVAGSVLDEALVRSLGTFDMVYAWEALERTGDLWRALGHAAAAVHPGGSLAAAVANRITGSLGVPSSERWRSLKHAYHAASPLGRGVMAGAVATWSAAREVVQRRPPGATPGHTPGHLDAARAWLGGYPYEFATADEVTGFLAARGFRVRQVVPAPPGAWASNVFVLARE